MEENENTENAEIGKRKHSHDTKIVIKYYYERIRQNKIGRASCRERV